MQGESIQRSLREHAFLAELTQAQLEFLAGCTKNVRFAPGEFLFKEGAPASELFLLRSGHVALESHAPGRGAVQVESLGAGGLLGWAALYPPHYWHIDARAVEPTLAFVIDGACVRGKLEADHDFGYAFLRIVLHEVHRRLERARLQQLDVYKAELA